MAPATEVTGKIAARAFLAHGAGVRIWPVPIQIQDGAARIVGTTEALTLQTLERGDWEALIAIGRPGAVPTSVEALEPALSGPLPADAGYRVVRVPLLLK